MTQFTYLLVLVLCFCSITINAQNTISLQRVGSSEAVGALGFERSDSSLIIYSPNAIQKTTDGGKNWKPLVNQAQTEHITYIDGEGQTIVSAGYDNVIQISRNNGKSWNIISPEKKMHVTGVATTGLNIQFINDQGLVYVVEKDLSVKADTVFSQKVKYIGANSKAFFYVTHNNQLIRITNSDTLTVDNILPVVEKLYVSEWGCCVVSGNGAAMFISDEQRIAQPIVLPEKCSAMYLLQDSLYVVERRGELHCYVLPTLQDINIPFPELEKEIVTTVIAFGKTIVIATKTGNKGVYARNYKNGLWTKLLVDRIGESQIDISCATQNITGIILGSTTLGMLRVNTAKRSLQTITNILGGRQFNFATILNNRFIGKTYEQTIVVLPVDSHDIAEEIALPACKTSFCAVYGSNLLFVLDSTRFVLWVNGKFEEIDSRIPSDERITQLITNNNDVYVVTSTKCYKFINNKLVLTDIAITDEQILWIRSGESWTAYGSRMNAYFVKNNETIKLPSVSYHNGTMCFDEVQMLQDRYFACNATGFYTSTDLLNWQDCKQKEPLGYRTMFEWNSNIYALSNAGTLYRVERE